MASNHQKESLLDVVVKEVIDPSFFWAQIGTESHFEEFKKDMREMSEWCESCPKGCHQDSSSVYVDLIVAIKDEISGDNTNWVRGKIAQILSESTVEVFLVDVGRVAIASVSHICAGFPPVLMKIPQQALHCMLAGVEQLVCSEEVESGSSWSEEATKVFKSLVTETPTKAIVRKVVDGKQILLSIFTPFEGKYTSIGEILRRKSLVTYQPSWPVTLDIPVPVECEKKSELAKSPTVVPEALPVAPILSQSYCDPGEDGEICISLDNSIVFDNEDDVSTLAPDLEESKDDEDGGVDQQEKNPEAEVARTCTNSGEASQDGSKDLSGVHLLGKGRGRGFLSEIAASLGPPTSGVPPLSLSQNSITGKLGLVSPSDQASCSLVSHMGAAGAKKLPKIDVASSILKEEIAKVTSRRRTEQEKQFLEEVLGGDDDSSSSSLSDSDWKDNKILPQPAENQAVETKMPNSTTIASSLFGSVSTAISEAARAKTKVFKGAAYDTQAGNTPHPMRRPPHSHHAYSDPLAGKYHGGKYRRHHDGVGYLTDRPARGRGGALLRDGHTGNRWKRDWRSFDKGMGAKKGRGRGQLHGSQYGAGHLTEGVPPEAEEDVVTTKMQGEDVGNKCVLPPNTSPVSDHESVVVKVSVSESQVASNSGMYCSKIESMSKNEMNDELEWQLWKFRNDIKKVVSEMDAGSMGNFDKEVDQLLRGPVAMKLYELPCSAPPLEVLVMYLVREGVFGTFNISSMARALDLLMEGQYGEGVCKVMGCILSKMATNVLECGVEEGKKLCCGLSQYLELLLTGSISKNASYADIIVSSIKKIFHIWGGFLGLDALDQSKTVQVFSYDFLLDTVSCQMPLFKETLSELLEGPIRSSILCRAYTQELRSKWLANAYKTLKKIHSTSSVIEKTVNNNMDTSYLSNGSNLKPNSAPELDGVQVADNGAPYSVHHTTRQASPQLPLSSSPSLPEQFVFPEPPCVAVEAEMHSASYSQPPLSSSKEIVVEVPDLYSQVTTMLEALQLVEILPQFKSSFIKDSVLDCDLDQVKSCLKEAGIPPGAILEIINYLKSGKLAQQSKFNSQSVSSRPPSRGIISSGHQVSTTQSAHRPMTHSTGTRPARTSLSGEPTTPPSPVPIPYTLPCPQPKQQLQHQPNQPRQHQNFQSSQQNRTQPQPMSAQQPPLQRPSSVEQLYTPSGIHSRPLLEAIPTSAAGYASASGGYRASSMGIESAPLHTVSSQEGLSTNSTRRNIGLPSTGQRIVSTSSVTRADLPVSASMPERVPGLSPVPPCRRPAHLESSSRIDMVSTTGPAPSVGGFGIISCVICGGKDHATYMCRHRDKRFTHM